MKFYFLALIVLSSVSFAKSQTKVLMVINDGFQPSEYLEPRKLFEKEGYLIKTASRYGRLAKADKKYVDTAPVPTDYSFDQIAIEDFDVITFTGGSGAWSDYFPNIKLHQILISAMHKPHMIVGLICAGTGILATANNLSGKTPQFAGRNITGYSEVEGLLVLIGKLHFSSGDLSKPYVVVDQNLITARDPMSSKLFGETIISRVNQK